MISTDKFLAAMKAAIGRLPNTGQAKAVKATKAQPLFIVAGPGTGKTATITMRMLKLGIRRRCRAQHDSRHDVYQEGC